MPSEVENVDSVLENLKKFTNHLKRYQSAENGLRRKILLEKILNLNCLFSILTDLLNLANDLKLQVDKEAASILIEFDKFTNQNCNDDGIFVFTYWSEIQKFFIQHNFQSKGTRDSAHFL